MAIIIEERQPMAENESEAMASASWRRKRER
jgi:hypothetical protein